ncbi:MAG TPA: hypothetical protein VL593_10790 [Ramlibacter sp.]|jgi:hypothetical protein|nr:hypothetical protein [Ramlibacter sp.]
MNTKIMKKQIVLAALALASAASFAQGTNTPRIDQREVKQQERITQGVASGQLTPAETARLDAQQARIEKTEAKAKSDGVVTAKERAHLTKMQNHASRHIRRQKHDAQHS